MEGIQGHGETLTIPQFDVQGLPGFGDLCLSCTPPDICHPVPPYLLDPCGHPVTEGIPEVADPDAEPCPIEIQFKDLHRGTVLIEDRVTVQLEIPCIFHHGF
jgi:hypothetical protein